MNLNESRTDLITYLTFTNMQIIITRFRQKNVLCHSRLNVINFKYLFIKNICKKDPNGRTRIWRKGSQQGNELHDTSSTNRQAKTQKICCYMDMTLYFIHHRNSIVQQIKNVR